MGCKRMFQSREVHINLLDSFDIEVDTSFCPALHFWLKIINIFSFLVISFSKEIIKKFANLKDYTDSERSDEDLASLLMVSSDFSYHKRLL